MPARKAGSAWSVPFRFLPEPSIADYPRNRNWGITVDPTRLPSLNCQQGVV